MRRRRFSWIALLILAVLVAGLGWLVYVPVRQERLNRSLIAAIKQNDTEKALTLLAEGADPNARDERPQSLTLWGLLLDRLRGKRPAFSSAPTALWVACAWGEENESTPGTWPPDNWPMVKALLERGAKVNVTDKTGKTPLLLAARLDKIQVSQLLIERGANVNATDINGWTPLKWAALIHYTDMVRLLVNNGADVNAVSYSKFSGDRTPLMLAQGAGEDDPAITEILLSKGAQVNARTPYERTALIEAILNKRERSVRTLIQHGADVTFKTSFRMTSLKLAKALRRSTIIQMLEQAGAKE